MSQVQEMIKDAEKKDISAKTQPQPTSLAIGYEGGAKDDSPSVWVFLFASMCFLALGLFLISKGLLN